MTNLATYAYTTTNIGDDVQSFAIEQILGERTKKVYRDFLYTQRAPVALVGNSWYFVTSPLSTVAAKLRGGRPFPPPDCVTPLYIGMSMGQRARRYMLAPEGLAHLKRFAPIGCRDHHTMQTLQQHGVEAWFSGCPTMTFENQFSHRDDTVYLVDVGRREQPGGLLRSLTSRRAHSPDMTDLIPKSIRRNAERITHFTTIGNRQEERRELVARLIRAYSTARLVITTRLHVALPCAALGTPCVLLHDSDSRFTGYDFVTLYNRHNIHTLDWNPDRIAIPDVSSFKQTIRRTVTDWVARMRGVSPVARAA